MKGLIDLGKDIFARVQKDKVSVFAAQATLFIIISALPFLMLLLSLLKFVLPEIPEKVMTFAGQLLPGQATAFIWELVSEVYYTGTIPVVSVTAVAALWAASKGVLALFTGLDNIYGLERGYIKSRALSVLYTVVLIISLSISLILLVAGQRIVELTESVFPVFHRVFEVFMLFPDVIYLVILTLIFTALYRYIPGQKISYARLLPGGFLAALGWVAYSEIYSFYINNFANYSIIYGSLTAVVLLMLWLYFCLNIFLWGAEINEHLAENPGKWKFIERRKT